MMDLFVYQMRLTNDSSLTGNKGELGWVFPSEVTHKFDDQSFVYTIPVQEGDVYKFPGLVGRDENYKEFSLAKGERRYVVEELGIEFTDSPQELNVPEMSQFLSLLQTAPLKYVGRNKELIAPGAELKPIFPMNVSFLDHLYMESRISLVGLTPVFPGN